MLCLMLGGSRRNDQAAFGLTLRRLEGRVVTHRAEDLRLGNNKERRGGTFCLGRDGMIWVSYKVNCSVARDESPPRRSKGNNAQ